MKRTILPTTFSFPNNAFAVDSVNAMEYAAFIAVSRFSCKRILKHSQKVRLNLHPVHVKFLIANHKSMITEVTFCYILYFQNLIVKYIR